MTKQPNESVDSLLQGLGGSDLRIGKKYYIFTVSYAYIGIVTDVNDLRVILGEDQHIVSTAGDEVDAVSQIVAGKKNPSAWERCPQPISIRQCSITATIPMAQ